MSGMSCDSPKEESRGTCQAGFGRNGTEDSQDPTDGSLCAGATAAGGNEGVTVDSEIGMAIESRFSGFVIRLFE